MENTLPSFEPYEGDKPYIFVSYSRKDQDLVVTDLNELHKSGFRIWYDRGIGAGAEWEMSIEEHIDRCKIFLIFSSKFSLESEMVHNEIALAKAGRNQGKLTIFPVYIEGNIDENNRNFQFLKGLNGLPRPNEPDTGYVDNLVWRLEQACAECREDFRDRDSKILGLGILPSNQEIYSEVEFTPEYIEKNRKAYVRRSRDNNEASYKIKNIFQLTSDKTQALQNLKEIRVKSSGEKPFNLVSLPLDIGETYIAPLRLISGLITRLDENWPPLVSSYGRLVIQGNMGLLDDLHYFIEFCWLAWGPSVLTTSGVSEKKFVVLQAAYGDEANSLPLIIRRRLWEKVEDKLCKTQNSFSGWPVSLKNVILVKPGNDDYFSEVRNSDLFKDMFTGKNKDEVAVYLPDGDEGYDCGEIELLKSSLSNSFYSTAYVWLMLEQIDKSSVKKGVVVKTHGLEPGQVLPFFEHANLATKKGLTFLQHCLARKAIYHVLECESDKDYREQGYYQFATALFPDEMLAILRKEIDRLNEKQKETIQDRLIIPKCSEDCRPSLDVVKFADALNNAIKDKLMTHEA
jgi:hypothetical protein